MKVAEVQQTCVFRLAKLGLTDITQSVPDLDAREHNVDGCTATKTMISSLIGRNQASLGSVVSQQLVMIRLLPFHLVMPFENLAVGGRGGSGSGSQNRT